MIPITREQLHLLAPNAHTAYKIALESAGKDLAVYGINVTPKRVAHFMAQILHVSDGLVVLEEDLNYSAKRMTEVWPMRFPTEADASPYAHNPEKLANKIYGDRLGNVNPGDGWRYIGRGVNQVTGREAYAKFGQLLGIDLESDPALAFDPRYTLKIAAAEWDEKHCNIHADNDDMARISRLLTGGLAGLGSRRDWWKKTSKIWF